MYNLSSINSLDFYFNGHWLSEYNGIIASREGFNTLSVLPSMETKTETVIGKDSVLEYDSYFNPRTFVIPVYFKDLGKIRDIAAWLGTKQSQDFYFKNDKLKIKAKLDSAVDITRYIYQGLTELKFIAYDPYYYAIEDLKYIVNKFDRANTLINPLTTYNALGVTSLPMENIIKIQDSGVKLYYDGIITNNNNVITLQITNFNNFQIYNDGNVESYPLIKITGSGNITVGINGKTFTVNNVNGYVYVDSLYMTCYKDATNYMPNFNGEFLTLQPGINTISVTGSITSMEIQCRGRWI